MLVIRMQRTGRKGHAMFRVVVQDSRRTPTSGKIVASLGNYDPHSKNVSLDKEKAQFYLDHGAQPSDRVALLLKAEGVKLPKWVNPSGKKAGKIRNLEKLRRNRPPEEVEEAPAEDAPAAEESAAEEATAKESVSEETREEAPVEAETTAEAEQAAENAVATEESPVAEAEEAVAAPEENAEEA